MLTTFFLRIPYNFSRLFCYEVVVLSRLSASGSRNPLCLSRIPLCLPKGVCRALISRILFAHNFSAKGPIPRPSHYYPAHQRIPILSPDQSKVSREWSRAQAPRDCPAVAQPHAAKYSALRRDLHAFRRESRLKIFLFAYFLARLVT